MPTAVTTSSKMHDSQYASQLCLWTLNVDRSQADKRAETCANICDFHLRFDAASLAPRPLSPDVHASLHPLADGFPAGTTTDWQVLRCHGELTHSWHTSRHAAWLTGDGTFSPLQLVRSNLKTAVNVESLNFLSRVQGDIEGAWQTSSINTLETS